MQRINLARVIIGGIVAGIVWDVLGYLVDGVLLKHRWMVGMKALGHTDLSPNMWIGFNLLGIVTGIALIWIYAAIRPRLGAGVKTAVYAGVIVWIVGVLVPNVSFMLVTGLFAKHLALYTTAGGLVEAVAGAIAGAALYKE
jgi:hypothetical protein